MSDDIFDIDDTDDVDLSPQNKAPSNRVDRFKGETGITYRAALMYFHPLSTSLVLASKRKARKEGTEVDKAAVKKALDAALAKRVEEYEVSSVDELAEWQKLDFRRTQFKKYKSHYKEGVGFVVSRLGKDGEEADKVWGMLGDPRDYYTTVILVYPTDREGNVEKELLLSRSTVKPWRFGRGSFNRLIEVEQKLKNLPGGGSASLANMDLSLKCTNDKFQNFDIDFASEAIWTKSKKVRDKFLPKAQALYEKLIDAKEMSTQDLRIKLGVGGDSGEDVSDDDVDDFLEGV